MSLWDTASRQTVFMDISLKYFLKYLKRKLLSLGPNQDPTDTQEGGEGKRFACESSSGQNVSFANR